MFEATDTQIAEWKAKHGIVKKIVFEDAACVVRKPTRKDLSYANTVSNGGKDYIRYNDVLLNNCWLAGDEVIKTDDAYAISAGGKVSSMVEIKESELLDC